MKMLDTRSALYSRYQLYGHRIYGQPSLICQGPLLSNILDVWSYRLYGQFLAGRIADHMSGIYCCTGLL